MSAHVVNVKRGDRRRTFQSVLKRKSTIDGVTTIQPTNLTTADIVVWQMRARGRHGAPLVSGTATVLDAPAGLVKYVTVAGDLDVVGLYEQEWEVTWPDGAKDTYPSDGFEYVRIGEDVD